MNKTNMKFNKIFQTIITFSFSILFFACANAFNDNSQSANNTIVNTEQKTVTITGQISIPDDFTESDAFPDKYHSLFESKDDTNARTAFPSAPTSTDYYVTAKIAGVATVNANISNESVTGATYTITFPIYDQSPDWDVEAGLKATFNENTEAIILKDTRTATITQTTPTFNHDFIIKPLTSGNGDVDLNISFETSGTADTLELYLGTTDIPTTPESAGTGETISTSKITLKNRTAGSYKAKLVFKKDGYVVFTDYQNINIFPNMTTDKWVRSGGDGPITSSNTYRVTDTLVSDYLITQIYVGNTAIDGSTITGSDTTGNGTVFAPYATFSKAIGYLQKNGKTNKDYTILIGGEITGAQTISDGTTASPTPVLANSITISGITGNTTDKLSGGTSESVLYLDTSVPVKISNLTITGGKGTTVSSTLYGGGIYINKGSVELTTGVVVDGNTADIGGGVYLAHGTLYLNDTAVVGKPLSALGANPTCAGTTSGTYANKATVTGGGISIEEGTLWLGYSSAATPAPVTTSGGVIYNLVSNASGSCHGGGIDNNKGTINFAKGNVKYNFACGSGSTSADIGSGGGISTAYTFNLSGDAVISNNKAANGGGVYITTNSTNGNLVMSGGTVSSNNAVKQPETNGYGGNGGGVNIETSATLSMSGGEISSNEAATSGGAIYHNGTFEITKVAGGTTCTAMIPKGTDNKNNIQLASTDKKIKITGQTNHAGNGAIAVTPARWNRGDQIFADGSTASYFSKFTLTDSEWRIVTHNSIGKLDADIWVASSLTNSTEAGRGTNVGVPPDSGRTGTKSKPYATIAEAVAQVWDTGTTKTLDFTINISGKITGNQTIANTVTNAKSITLLGDSTATKKELYGGNSGTVLTVASKVPITIQNLTVTGGNKTGDGGGINMQADNAKLILTEGAVVTANTASGNGGGIYFAGASGKVGLLKMDSTASISSNTATGNGGGLYMSYADLCMSGTALIGETASAPATNTTGGNKATNGGGVYVASTGCIWLGYSAPSDNENAVLALTDGYGILHNYASACGGGIYNNGGTVKMKTGAISYNGTAIKTIGAQGGGIYNLKGTVNLSGGQITRNQASYGGGIYSSGENNAVDAKVFLTGTALIGGSGTETASASTGNYAEPYGNNDIYSAGGGVYNTGANIYLGYASCDSDGKPTNKTTLTGGIRQNYASYKVSQTALNTAHAGGVFLSNYSKLYFDSGNISYNSACRGGGIYLNTEWNDLTMTGGNIENNIADNTSEGKGGAVYIQSLNGGSFGTSISNFELSGTTASIPSTGIRNNDIYLVASKIKINGNLGNSFAAKITSSSYSDGNQVLEPKSNSDSDIAYITNNFTKFSLTNSSYYIISNGTMFSVPSVQSVTTFVSGNTYAACSQSDFSSIATKVSNGTTDFSNITIKLASDMTLDSTYTGIGSSSKPFKGIFDGNNKTVNYDNARSGIFKYTENATIKDLNITGTISTTDSCGAVATQIVKSSIDNCTSSCNITVTGNSSSVGGIVGTAGVSGSAPDNRTDCIISNCLNTGTVTSSGSGGYTAGIVAQAYICQIINCEQRGNVTGTWYVAGILASANNQLSDTYSSFIENCCMSGNVIGTGSSDDYCGGIFGSSTTDKSLIINCCFDGDITSHKRKGGIVGLNKFSGSCDNCYFKGGEDLGTYGEDDDRTVYSGSFRDTSINNTVISQLNSPGTNITTYSSLSSYSQYKSWQLSSGKPQLVWN